MTDEQIQDFASIYGLSLEAARLALTGKDLEQARQERRRQLADLYGVDVRYLHLPDDERTADDSDGNGG